MIFSTNYRLMLLLFITPFYSILGMSDESFEQKTNGLHAHSSFPYLGDSHAQTMQQLLPGILALHAPNDCQKQFLIIENYIKTMYYVNPCLANNLFYFLEENFTDKNNDQEDYKVRIKKLTATIIQALADEEIPLTLLASAIKRISLIPANKHQSNSDSFS